MQPDLLAFVNIPAADAELAHGVVAAAEAAAKATAKAAAEAAAAAERPTANAADADVAHPASLARTIALGVQYLGTNFSGFARQKEPHVLTVQGELERALGLLYRRDVKTVCAGRTDAGVHARGQVVTYDVSQEEYDHRTCKTLMRSLNALVHDDIAVTWVEERPFGFSARFDAQWREYHYHICTLPYRPALIAPLVWSLLGVDLDMDAMNVAAAHLVGEHDFKSFCMAASAEGKTTMRNVMSLEVYPETIMGYDVITVRVVGNAFLHSMVRTIVGTLVEVCRGRKDPDWVGRVLAACDRRAAGQNAPASGLVFWHVEYEG